MNEQVICIQSKRYNVTTLGVYSCTSNHDVKNSSSLLVLLNLFIVLSLPDLKLQQTDLVSDLGMRNDYCDC